MNNKIKNIMSICMIILFIILMIVYGIRKNHKSNINNTVEENSINTGIVEKEIENDDVIENSDIKIEDEKDNTIIQNNESKNENIKENKITNVTKEIEQEQKNISVTSSYDINSFNNGYLENYPDFGTQYATLIIEKIGINAPIFFGVTDEIILQGVGHDSGSYFPGENGTIIMCEHNYMNNFSELGNLTNEDVIEIKTNYGDFYYKLYDEQVVMETESYKLPIQEEKEILMIYTCYPFKNNERTQYRYVIYAEKI